MTTEETKFVEQLRDLKESGGWKIIVDNLKLNIEDAQTQIEELKEKEKDPVAYMANMNALLDKKSDRETLMVLPDILIRQMEGVTGDSPNMDPYATDKDLEPEE